MVQGCDPGICLCFRPPKVIPPTFPPVEMLPLGRPSSSCRRTSASRGLRERTPPKVYFELCLALFALLPPSRINWLSHRCSIRA